MSMNEGYPRTRAGLAQEQATNQIFTELANQQRVVTASQLDTLKPPEKTGDSTNQVYTRRRDAKAAAKHGQKQLASPRHSRSGSPNSSAAPEQIAKKRGRKREQWNHYVAAARDKIREYKAKLKTAKKDKVEVKTR